MPSRSSPPIVAIGDGSVPLTDYLRHNYARKLRALQLAGTLPPGVTRHVTIRHDAWCSLLQQPAGYCNCDPEITLGPTLERGDS